MSFKGASFGERALDLFRSEARSVLCTELAPPQSSAHCIASK